jgi:biopolymer transport protein ExbB/TolQ
MLVTFYTIGRSSTALNAEQVARGISVAMIPTLAVVPLGAIGILLLILGFVFRRPVAEQKGLRPRG